ncbi:hypothetical protein DHW03_09325 [Pedobacter yonginense]|uniref:Hemolysin III n=1 Tax=Pedobacter yonginense TaxID=651869 RepID=A0A317ERJ4_9SPHI|nr:hypothetical protein [Pedobacter yonginense]PWS27768.1 hypothetical protein DHW03_09325 [Pedobacter yonginense]
MSAFIQNPPDGGTMYTETNLSQLFPEPLNTLTSCFFLGIAVYWTFKLWGDFKQHTFLSIALVLLYIGGIGGTTYHGFRRWPIFIVMDWLPIMLLCLSAGVYFLAKLTKWYYAVLIVVVYALFQIFLRRQFVGGDFQIFININYAFMAALVLFPVFGYLLKTEWLNGKWVGFALISFIFALTFRIADKWEVLTVGTHFLWHSFGAVASFCMLYYIYLVNAKKSNLKKTLP